MRTLRADAFQIGFPNGWQDQSQVTMVGPPRPGFAPNITVNQEPRPAEMSPAQYFEQQRSELQAELEAFNLIRAGDRLLGGLQALFHEFTWRIPSGVEIRQLQLVSLRGGVLYTVTASATIPDWEQFEPIFEQAIAAFRFGS